MNDLLKKNIAKYTTFSEEEFLMFYAPFKTTHVRRKQMLLRAGEVCKFEAFVTKGCFKIYYIDNKGFEHIIYFAIEDWWIGDIDSFLNQTPAHLNIEALEDSEILIIGKEDKEALYAQLPKVEKLFRLMGQKTHVALQRRMIEHLSKTAGDRYLLFIEKYPKLAQRLTNIEIAAYLGISHEFLSKIRKKRL